MSSRESRWDDEQQRQQDEDWKPPKKASIWPFVATVIAAFALKHWLSLKRRPVASEGFTREAYGSKADGSGGRATRGNTIHYTYVTWDGRKTEGYVWREATRVDDPWSRFWKDGFFDIEELERLERTRRMQEAYHRMRPSNAKSYEAWEEYKRTSRRSAQETTRVDWTWGKADWDAWRNAGPGRFQSQPQSARESAHAHHYRNLGLDPSRTGTYSQDELKVAFRAKALEYHPDRNQHRKEFAEAKFREILSSYEALKVK